MNKTKTILTGFAVFASILILSTTCIATPIQQNTSMDAVESTQQETTESNNEISTNIDETVKLAIQDLIKAIESIITKMKNDLYLNSLIDKISKDPALNQAFNVIKNTNDLNKKMALAKSFADVLKSKQDFTYLKAYFERSYSIYIQDIKTKSDKLTTLIEEKGLDTTDEYYNYFLSLIDYLQDLNLFNIKSLWFPGCIPIWFIIAVFGWIPAMILGVIIWPIIWWNCYLPFFTGGCFAFYVLTCVLWPVFSFIVIVLSGTYPMNNI